MHVLAHQKTVHCASRRPWLYRRLVRVRLFFRIFTRVHWSHAILWRCVRICSFIGWRPYRPTLRNRLRTCFFVLFVMRLQIDYVCVILLIAIFTACVFIPLQMLFLFWYNTKCYSWLIKQWCIRSRKILFKSHSSAFVDTCVLKIDLDSVILFGIYSPIRMSHAGCSIWLTQVGGLDAKNKC